MKKILNKKIGCLYLWKALLGTSSIVSIYLTLNGYNYISALLLGVSIAFIINIIEN